MDKQDSAAPAPLVTSGMSAGSSTQNASVDSGSEKGQVHQFNEQTSYVPKRTIITIFLACASVDLLALMD